MHQRPVDQAVPAALSRPSAPAPGTPRPAGPAEFPLLSAQAGIHYAGQINPKSPALNTADVVEIQGTLDETLFERALLRTVTEAETLGVCVSETDGEPRQRVLPPDPERLLHRIDLRDAGRPAEEAARDWMHTDLTRAADLGEAGQLTTQALFRVADDRYWWYQRVHHIAVDAYALQLVGSRVAELYTALATGQEPAATRFAPLRDLVEEETRYLESEQYTADREFWTARMAGRPEPVTPASGAGAGRAGALVPPMRHVPRRPVRPSPPRRSPTPSPPVTSSAPVPTCPPPPWTGSPAPPKPSRRPGRNWSSPPPPATCTASPAPRTSYSACR
ncbi:condensation domain-containing protein [Streptomyces sp. Ac-502]|uniref:condensation domain-containing protein n=1 Tax=Streptomyces sp. Ac-502 TaxID=3342801 RepID=UPI0038705778